MRDPRLQQILERSASDPAFRRLLLTEPHRAVREAFGIEIPLSFRIRFIEKGPDDDALIVLPNAARPPARQPEPEGELDEASLEAVAGGWGDGDWNQGDELTPGAEWSEGQDWSNWK
jgi:hypothetical protein